MKSVLLLALLFSAGCFAQITDGGFELGTFNSAVTSGQRFSFINSPAEAHAGNGFGAIVLTAPSSGSLRTLTAFDAGLVEPGGVYAFSFFAKKPGINGFNQINISASGGGAEAPISRATIEAPTSLTGVWMIHSYQFTIPANWNPANILRVSLSTEPISPVVMGQTYSFHLDDMTLTQIAGAAVPEPHSAALAAGWVVILTTACRRRRSPNLP
jgi:hypothetical protein